MALVPVAVLEADQVAAASPLTYSFDCAGGSLLVVAVEVSNAGGAASNISGITYNLVALTRAVQQQWDTSNASSAEIWYLENPAAGANNVVVTCTGTASNIHSGAMSFTGHTAKHPIRQTAKATGNSTAPSATIPAVLEGNTVISWCGCGQAQSGWSGQVLLFNNNKDGTTAGNNVAMMYSSAKGFGGEDIVCSYTILSDFWGVVAVEVSGDQATLTESSGAATADVLLGVYGPIRYLGETAFQTNAFQENAFQIGGGVASTGPFTYNESESEQVIAQDVLLAALGSANGYSETALAQDTLATAQGMLAVLQEQALARDVLSTAQGMPQGYSEQALAQDSSGTVQGLTQITSEQVIAQEASLTAEGMNASEAEQALAQDTLKTAQLMLVSLAEAVQGQDVVLSAQGMAAFLSEASAIDVLLDNAYFPGGVAQLTETVLLQDLSLAAQGMNADLAEASAIDVLLDSTLSRGARSGNVILMFDD